MRTDTLDSIERYLHRLEIANPQNSYGYDMGRTYAKLWMRPRGDSSRSIVAFVDDDGGFYKADSWRKRGRFINHIDTILHRGAPSLRDVSPRRLSAKIERLHREGYRGKQAIAVAYSMLGERRPKRRRVR